MKSLSLLLVGGALFACGGEIAQEDLASQFDQAADAAPAAEEPTETEASDAAEVIADGEAELDEAADAVDNAAAEFGAMMQDLEEAPE